MALQFKKAKKSAAKVRLAISGPSGGGKTYTALAIGSKLGKSVAVIDTERGSASLYADQFEFDALELPNFEIQTYLDAMKVAAETGHDVLIIDGISPAWEWLKEHVEHVSRAKFRGNSWSAWSEGTPLQTQFIEAILSYPGHVIATMRTKTAWETEKDEKGKTKPVKVGLAPVQRENIEYEWTIVLEVSEGGLARVGKTRWAAIDGKVFNKPGSDFAADLLSWLNDGEPAPQDPLASKRAELVEKASPLPQERRLKFLEFVRDAKDSKRLEELSSQLESVLKNNAKTPQAAPQNVSTEKGDAYEEESTEAA